MLQSFLSKACYRLQHHSSNLGLIAIYGFKSYSSGIELIWYARDCARSIDIAERARENDRDVLISRFDLLVLIPPARGACFLISPKVRRLNDDGSQIARRRGCAAVICARYYRNNRDGSRRWERAARSEARDNPACVWRVRGRARVRAWLQAQRRAPAGAVTRDSRRWLFPVSDGVLRYPRDFYIDLHRSWQLMGQTTGAIPTLTWRATTSRNWWLPRTAWSSGADIRRSVPLQTVVSTSTNDLRLNNER